MIIFSRKVWRFLRYILYGVLGFIVLAFGVALGVHRAGVEQADRAWERMKHPPLRSLGSTETLQILPLVDWYTARDDLMGAMGVSYLVRTDDHTLLFDVGNNPGARRPSPLVHNMEVLGVHLNDIDTVFISHAHYDHIGGRMWSGGAISGNTFGIGHRQPDLGDRQIVTPVEMVYPGASPQVTREATRLADGVATTGTILRHLFIGEVREQALVVNVFGKGLVLIVGCGHQTLPRLVEHVQKVFEPPIYGFVGGVHYPVPDGRVNLLGLNAQRRLASGRGPLDPLSWWDIERQLFIFQNLEVGLLAVSAHDSSDRALERMLTRFPEAYRPLRVGEPIVVQ